MHKYKLLAVATMPGIAFASVSLAKAPAGKIGWQELDINSDGVISFLEFQEQEQFELGPLDVDEDGLLSLDEFLQPNRKKASQKKLPEDFLEKRESLAIKKFEKMDTDFNGFVDAAELHDARFDAMDKNGDGVLSRKELRQKRQVRGAKDKRPQGKKAPVRMRGKREILKRNWRQWQRD